MNILRITRNSQRDPKRFWITDGPDRSTDDRPSAVAEKTWRNYTKTWQRAYMIVATDPLSDTTAARIGANRTMSNWTLLRAGWATPKRRAIQKLPQAIDLGRCQLLRAEDGDTLNPEPNVAAERQGRWMIAYLQWRPGRQPFYQDPLGNAREGHTAPALIATELIKKRNATTMYYYQQDKLAYQFKY